MNTEKEDVFITEDALPKRPDSTETEKIGDTTDGDMDIIVHAGMAGSEAGKVENLKLAEDGHTVLIPQPTEDPDDPLNWSSKKKHTMLLIVAISAFLGDFGSGAGIPSMILQAEEWNMTVAHVNYAGNLNIVMLGIGGLIFVPLSSIWGRVPVMFWTTLSGALFTLACAVAPNFSTYYGFRALMGLTLTATQTVGLACIKDMFFFHEHARKIGIWAGLFILSPYCGPFFGNFIIGSTGQWRPVMWLVFGVCCLDLVLIVLFADESYYRRDIPLSAQPKRGSRLMRVIGVWQIRNHSGYFLSTWTSVQRLTSVLFKPIVIPVMFYYMIVFMWGIGINISSSIIFETPVAAGGYGFSTITVGFVYFTPIIAVGIGEIFGHFFNDYLANRYIQKHKGHFKPEARLPGNYLGAILMIPGLILVGQALEKHLHWSAVVIGWGVYTLGVMISSVGITAYLLDSYQNGSAEVSGLLNFARVIGGFALGYFQQPWGKKAGYGTSFGIQAAIVALDVCILTGIYIYGPKLRAKGGKLVL